MKFKSKYKTLQAIRCISNCPLQNMDDFCPLAMELERNIGMDLLHLTHWHMEDFNENLDAYFQANFSDWWLRYL